ncbi:MAG: sporulation protein YabP [Clostridia bacterium]|nr:sporulation protein YabP [Clostridia bacterium]
MEQNIGGESKLILDSRMSILLTGVIDIVSFDEASVYLETTLGGLLIEGSGLHITDFSLEKQTLTAEGNINALTYSDAGRTGGGFLKRIFG